MYFQQILALIGDEYPRCHHQLTKAKIINQLLKYLKLLIINKIINIEDIYRADTFGITIWEQIKKLTYLLNNREYSEFVMESVVDLIIACINTHSFDEQEAILRIMVRKVVYNHSDPGRKYLRDKVYIMNITEAESEDGYNYKMCNTNHIIDRLLFVVCYHFKLSTKIYNSYMTVSKIHEEAN